MRFSYFRNVSGFIAGCLILPLSSCLAFGQDARLDVVVQQLPQGVHSRTTVPMNEEFEIAIELPGTYAVYLIRRPGKESAQTFWAVSNFILREMDPGRGPAERFKVQIEHRGDDTPGFQFSASSTAVLSGSVSVADHYGR